MIHCVCMVYLFHSFSSFLYLTTAFRNIHASFGTDEHHIELFASPACMSTNVARFRLATVKLNPAAERGRESLRLPIGIISRSHRGARCSHHQHQQQQLKDRAAYSRDLFWCHMRSLCACHPQAAKLNRRRIGVRDLLAECWYQFE